MAKDLLLITTEFPPYPGGIATYSYNMAFYAQLHGINVSVLAPTYEYKAKADLEFNFRFIPWIRGGFDKRKIFRLKFLLYKILKQETFDLVHALDWPSIVILDLVNIFLRKKNNYIATIYGTDIYVLEKLLNKYPFLRYILFKHNSKVHYISNYTYNLAQKKIKFLLESKESVIQGLGINQQFLRKGSIDIYEKYGIPRNKKIILSVSRLDDRKGHIDAIKALNMLPDRLKKTFIYVIVGKKVDSPYHSRLLAILNSSSFEYNYLGVVDFEELISLYENSYLFLLPGKFVPGKVEGFGLAYLEAASKGLPSIAYKVYAVPEVVIDGKTGFLVDEGDIKSLSKKIQLLLENEKLHKFMSFEAKKHSRNFSWETCVERLYKSGGNS